MQSPAPRRARIIPIVATMLLALVLILAGIWLRFFADFEGQANGRTNGQTGVQEIRTAIAFEAPEFSRTLRRPVRAVEEADGRLLDDGYRCRWVYQHTDMGFTTTAANGCEAEFYIDPQRTRLVRFDLDPWMGVDVIVYSGDTRVAFASARLRYLPD